MSLHVDLHSSPPITNVMHTNGRSHSYIREGLRVGCQCMGVIAQWQKIGMESQGRGFISWQLHLCFLSLAYSDVQRYNATTI